MAPDFDPNAPEFIADPYPTYARLRRDAPIFWHEPTSSLVRDASRADYGGLA